MKVGILTSTTLTKFQKDFLIKILEDRNLSIDIALIDGRSKKSLKKKLKQNLKRGRGGYILIMGIRSLFKKKGKAIYTEELCKNYSIPFYKTAKPYSKDTTSLIKNQNIDILVLVSGFGIIKEPLLSSCPKGILSYHHGDMRKYRGMPAGFWELFNNESTMGLTVQKIAKGLDCGAPIVEKTIPILKNDTLRSLKNRALYESIDMMHDALLKIKNKSYTVENINELGKVYTLPNLRQWLQLNLKTMFRFIK